MKVGRPLEPVENKQMPEDSGQGHTAGQPYGQGGPAGQEYSRQGSEQSTSDVPKAKAPGRVNPLRVILRIVLIIFVLNLLRVFFVGLGANPNHSKGKMNRFFGKGNWEVTDVESRKSTVKTYQPDLDYFSTNDYDYETYTVWTVSYTDPWGDECETEFDSRESVPKKLLDVYLHTAKKRMEHDYVSQVYSQEDIDDRRFDFSRINPWKNDHSFIYYWRLLRQSWFTLQDADYLKLYTFDPNYYYEVKTNFDHGPAMGASKEDVEGMKQKAEKLSELLCEYLGDKATFEIYFSIADEAIPMLNFDVTEEDLKNYETYIAYCNGKEVPAHTDLIYYIKYGKEKRK